MRTTRIIFLLLIALSLISCSSASSTENQDLSNQDVITERAAEESPEAAIPVEQESAPMSQEMPTSSSELLDKAPSSVNILDYFPFKPDFVKTFKGEGNEFADFTMQVQYMDNNRIQYMTNNGGTQVVTVYEKTENEVKVVFTQGEVYYRENMLDRTGNIGTYLRGPVEVGTTWVNANQQEATITDVDVLVEGISSIEVKTATDVYYYGYQVGLVKQILNVDSEPVVSTLSEVSQDGPVDVSYAVTTHDGQSYVSNPVVSKMKTNDVFRLELSKEMVKLGVLPKDTILNSLVKNRTDQRVYADISSKVYEGLESRVQEDRRLQSIVKTIGSIYNTDQIYLWVDGGAYKGPYVSMSKNELLKIIP